jgi:hypothetical protein
LPRERNDVRLPHLHSLGRNTPLAPAQVEFRPLGGAQLARPHEDVGCQPYRGACRDLPLMTLDRSQQLADPGGIGDGGIALGSLRRQCPFEIGADVPSRPPRRNGVAEYAAADGPDAMRRVRNASLLEALEDASSSGASISPTGRLPRYGLTIFMSWSRSRCQVLSVSEPFLVSSHSWATAAKVIARSCFSSFRFAPGSMRSQTNLRAASRRSRASLSDIVG